MNSEQLQILAEIYAVNARILGMHADNQARKATDQSPAWVYADFAEESRQLENLAQQASRA